MDIIDHNHHAFKKRWEKLKDGNQYNGAYFYSQEIVNNIIPNVHTKKPWNWMTVSVPTIAKDRTVFFVHDNTFKLWKNFECLKSRKQFVFVCGWEKAVKELKKRGFKNVIYLPRSVDVEYVKQFRVPEKTKEAAFCGRKATLTRDVQRKRFPPGIDFIYGLPREEFLQKMAQYKKVYAIGRVAIEAKVLGCEIGVYDTRYPDPNYWKILDNSVAAKILERKLNELDEKWGIE